MKLWKDMTPEEKGALLLAYHEGKEVEYYSDVRREWFVTAPVWAENCAYRVKPKPVVKEVVVHGCKDDDVWSFDSLVGPAKWDTHKITFNLVDGEPDCNSIKMVKL